MRFPVIELFDWFKRQPHDLLDLASSGVDGPKTIGELGLNEDLPIGGDNHYGFRPLKEAIAHRYHVTAEQVVITPGASMANFAVMAALLNSGDRIVVESPCYQPFIRLASAVTDRKAALMERRAGDTFHITTPNDTLTECHPQLLIATNLHNPTGMNVPTEKWLALADQLAAWGGWLLLDEVFLPFLTGYPDNSLAGKHPRIVTVGSLTKAWGLSGLRVGWVIAPAHIARRVEQVMDYLHVVQPFMSEYIAHKILTNGTADRLLAAARQRAKNNWIITQRTLSRIPDVDSIAPDGGITVWVRFRDGRDAAPFCSKLLEERRTIVMPGFYFGEASCFRIGFGAEPDILQQGLQAIQDLIS